MAEVTPTVSVVIASYNGATTITNAIESALGTDGREQADEVIVIDDGSTDGTNYVVEQLCTKYPQIVLRTQENLGRCAARNYGASLALGEYVVFLDDDDLLSVDAIKTFKHEASRTPYVGIIRLCVDYLGTPLVLRTPPTDLFDGPSIPGSFALRTSLFAHVGGYDVNLDYAENSDLLWRLHRLAIEGGGSQEVLSCGTVGVHHHHRHDVATYYRTDRINATRLLIDKHADALQERPALAASLHGILAHDLTQIGETAPAFSYAWQSLRLRPAARSTARLGRVALHHAWSVMTPTSNAA